VFSAVSRAERGLKSHLLLRGEQHETLTDYVLISTVKDDMSARCRGLIKQIHLIAL